MLIDTHCHLDFKQFEEDRQEVIDRAQEQGISRIINVASDLNGARAALKLANNHDFIFATAGIHPHYVLQTGNNELEELKRILEEKKIVAVGEVGLDYFNHDCKGPLADKSIKLKQQELFNSFVEIAINKKLPIILHCRDAHDDLLAILKSHLQKEIKAVVHCFSGSKDFLKSCLDLDFKVSFTGNITYKKADDLRQLVSYVPLDEMFLETDAPFLAPQEKRGQRNEPAYTKYIAEAVARIKNTNIERVADITTRNACAFFNIT